MKYFLANLSIHIIVTIVILVFVIIFSNRNKRGLTKHAPLYFLPLVLSILAVLYAVRYTAPRLLDISAVSSENFYSYTGELESVSPFNNSLVVDGETYYINPLRDIPEDGTTVKIRYSRYGRYAVEVIPAEEVSISDSLTEEMQTSMPVTETEED